MLKKAVCVLAACAVGLGLFCGCGDTPQGTFYTLQEAYDNGYLTREDLMSIAYYHNGGRMGNEEIMAENYAPIPKNPEKLNEEVKTAIKETAAYDLRHNEQEQYTEAKAEGIWLDHYYGTYQNMYVAVIHSNTYEPAYPTEVIEVWEKVGSVSFHYWMPFRISIWKEN